MKTITQPEVDQALVLADLISSSVRRIAQLSARNTLGILGIGSATEEIETNERLSEATRCIVAASAQLSSLVRSPAEVIMDHATSVSTNEHIPIIQCTD